MSQYDWLTIDPDDEDGTELATRLNTWMAAVESNHRGSTEPTYVRAGMLWPKQVSSTVEQINYYDGAQSVLLATVNPTTHAVVFPVASLPAATTSAQGASELLTTTELLTGTDTTRTATADAIAALWEDGGQINASGSIALGEGGSFELITSTANITGFTFSVAKTGRRATLRFSTVRTLVNGANLILQGGANITTAVGDLAEVEDRGGGVARLKYYRADGKAVVTASSVTRDYIGGLTLSNNAVTPNTKVDVAAGQCADSTNAVMIDFAGGTLNLATTGVNGLRTGSLAANTWYGVFVIEGTSGKGLFGDTALTPGTRPAGYTTDWRRIGVILTDASAHVKAFVQTGRWFSFKGTPLSIFTHNISGSAGSPQSITLPMITGKKWTLRGPAITYWGRTDQQYMGIADPDIGSYVLADILNDLSNSAGTTFTSMSSEKTLITSTSSQIIAWCSANASDLTIVVKEWFDDGLP